MSQFLVRAVILLCSHTVDRESSGVLSSPYKGTSAIELGPHLWDLFTFITSSQTLFTLGVKA
jgi:hypothetical protein